MKGRGYMNTKNIRAYQTNPDIINPMKRMSLQPSSRPSQPSIGSSGQRFAGPNRSHRVMQMNASHTRGRPMDQTMNKSWKRQQSVNNGNQRSSQTAKSFSRWMDTTERGSRPPIRSPSHALPRQRSSSASRQRSSSANQPRRELSERFLAQMRNGGIPIIEDNIPMSPACELAGILRYD